MRGRINLHYSFGINGPFLVISVMKLRYRGGAWDFFEPNLDSIILSKFGYRIFTKSLPELLGDILIFGGEPYASVIQI